MTNIHQKLLMILRNRFGFYKFRPGQEAVLRALCQGRNVLAVLPTGAGKTLIYQLYGYLTPRLIIIISPLLSLMRDQVSRMQYNGIKSSAALNSLLDYDQKLYLLSHLTRYHYLYLSPEMLSNPRVLNRLRQIPIGLVVIDEAHCISQWGPDFRPEYLNLKRLLKQLANPQVLMLTATASVRLRSDIINRLGFSEDQVKELVYPVNRTNIFLSVKSLKNDHAKLVKLMDLVKHLVTPGIVYFSSKRQADQVAKILEAKCQVRTAPYHSGLDQESRYRIQHQFMNDQIDVICATSAFGMGIDKENVRFVIHYHLPSDLGAYMQEIGRAGRDGKQSIAILLYADGDERLPYNLSVERIPTPSMIRRFFMTPNRFLRFRNRDEQIKVLNYYRIHYYSMERTVRILVHYRRQREADLKYMVRYVKIRRCKRQYLLKYFNEKVPPHDQKCCSYHNSVNLKDLGLYIDHHSKKNLSLQWLPLIKQLFNVPND